MDRTPYWTEHWNDIVARVSARRHLFVACDFDGALAPIVAHPDDACVSNEVRCLLRKLATCRGLTLAIFSERTPDEVKARVSIDGIFYASHDGLDGATGTTLHRHLAHFGLTPADAIYIGGSQARKDAFNALRGVLTLSVGSNAAITGAQLRLNDTSDTAAFLFCLLGARLAASQSSSPANRSADLKPAHFPPLPF